jgi:hypothetical protein
MTQAAILVASLSASPATVGSLAALSCLLRPDSILFSVPIILLNTRLRTWKTLLAFLIPGVLWISFTLYYYHAWLPQSFYAKKGLVEIQPFLMVALPGVDKIDFLWQEQSAFFWAAVNFSVTLGSLINKRIRQSGFLVYALLVYPWILIAAYSLIGTPPGHSWEYRSAIIFNTLAFYLGFLSIITCLVNKIEHAGSGLSNLINQRLVSYSVLFCVLAFSIQSLYRHVERIHADQSSYWWGGRHETYLAVSDWLRANVSPLDKVLYGEPGTIAYFSERFVSDNFLISHVAADKADFVIRQGDIIEWREANVAFHRVAYFERTKFEPMSILKREADKSIQSPSQ